MAWNVTCARSWHDTFPHFFPCPPTSCQLCGLPVHGLFDTIFSPAEMTAACAYYLFALPLLCKCNFYEVVRSCCWSRTDCLMSVWLRSHQTHRALYYKHQWEEAEHRRTRSRCVYWEHQSLRMMKIRSRNHQGHYTPLLGSPPARFRRSLCFQIFIWHHIFGSNDVSDNEDTFFGFYFVYIFILTLFIWS